MTLDADVKGDAYEGLLQKNAEDTKSGAGQYFTPRPLIRAMVEVMQPSRAMTICDPACGTGGFLLAAHEWIVDQHIAELDPDEKRFLRDEALHGLGDRRQHRPAVRDEPAAARHRHAGRRQPDHRRRRAARPTRACGSTWC